MDCVRTVNRQLTKSGVWVNTGSLAFFHRDAAWCYSQEEAVEILARTASRWSRPSARRCPTCNRPRALTAESSACLALARASRDGKRSEADRVSPPWCATRTAPCRISTSSSSLRPPICLKAQALAAIDGRRTIDEIAVLVAKRYGLQRSEARGAVERILLETSKRGGKDHGQRAPISNDGYA